MPPKVVQVNLPNGTTVEMYYVGALCEALNRTPLTLRLWMQKGIIPEPSFKDLRGRRLYTKEEIDAIVKAAKDADLKKGRIAINSTTFSQECHKSLLALRNKYLGGGPTNVA